MALSAKSAHPAATDRRLLDIAVLNNASRN
jgi:hypothetical protein